MSEITATVCVDAMGGDEPPSVVLEGVALALEADEHLEVIITGSDEVVTPFAQSHDRCRAVVCTQSIAMDEHPVEAIRTKRDSSIVVGCQQVKRGEAQAFFSAGSTGACMAAATLTIGRIKGIDRPALTLVLPGVTPTVFLDVGANADTKASNIVQYAHMGAAYSRIVVGKDNPRVGLLNIGSEDTKGSMYAQECFAALKEQVPEFVGNAEGTDILGDAFDVIVTDGFTGNVALKTIEGSLKRFMALFKDVLTSSARTKMAALMLKPSLHNLKNSLGGDATGGAVLLGIKGVVLIGHGATSPQAVKNGTLAAARAVRDGLVDSIASRVS